MTSSGQRDKGVAPVGKGECLRSFYFLIKGPGPGAAATGTALPHPPTCNTDMVPGAVAADHKMTSMVTKEHVLRGAGPEDSQGPYWHCWEATPMPAASDLQTSGSMRKVSL